MEAQNKRLSLYTGVFLQFMAISALVRGALFVWAFSDVDFSLFHFFHVFLTGAFFDLGVISFFLIVYNLYLIALPNKWAGNRFDKSFTYTYFLFTTLVQIFSFFAEFTFWDEFQNRFNFIAVDYLVYTNEVVQNIHESYPLPFLFLIVFSLVAALFFAQKKLRTFKDTFQSKITRIQRIILAATLIVPVIFIAFITNNQAEWSKNRVENELSKAGIYSFFAAFRSNELSYEDFYQTIPLETTFQTIKPRIIQTNDSLTSTDNNSITRIVKASNQPEIRPNVIFICVESLSGEFLDYFGNDKHLTPNLDSLINRAIIFNNLYAVGTRTVRGMEAYTLSVPPLPGQSIVKRKLNKNLYTIGNVFHDKGYHNTFFYGGDGYFDNMNDYFSGYYFDLVDRGRQNMEKYPTRRTLIPDADVTLENAWGICDEDIYKQVIKSADQDFASNKPFFNYVMTTSNHRPFTYPEGKIDIPSGSGRDGAIKYTDYAIGEFIRQIKSKPWFQNTIIVIAADHCANSAGKWELNIDKYHIPGLIYNLPGQAPAKIDHLCSQIDLFPTLWGYLNWTYESRFYGKDVNKFTTEDQRAFISNYRKLGFLTPEKLCVLGDMKKINSYTWDGKNNKLMVLEKQEEFEKEAISYYQSQSFLYNQNKK